MITLQKGHRDLETGCREQIVSLQAQSDARRATT